VTSILNTPSLKRFYFARSPYFSIRTSVSIPASRLYIPYMIMMIIKIKNNKFFLSTNLCTNSHKLNRRFCANLHRLNTTLCGHQQIKTLRGTLQIESANHLRGPSQINSATLRGPPQIKSATRLRVRHSCGNVEKYCPEVNFKKIQSTAVSLPGTSTSICV